MTATSPTLPAAAPASDGESACRSMAAAVEVVTATAADAGPGPHAVTTLYVAADEPVFDGHYPGFPILPGVCLIECVHRSALVTARASGLPAGLTLGAVDSARFLAPVFPDETVTVELTWKADGADWQVRAVVRTERAESARIRLRYAAPPAVGQP